MNLKISFAPIQGVTDYVFRNEYRRHFGGVDEYYAPYLRNDKEKEFKTSKLKDILPENNIDTPLIPQIMTNNSEDFNLMVNRLSNLGYKHINWNLGCPYPMVTNRKLGAGLLPHHDIICKILEKSLPKSKAQISIKLRSGLTDDKELELLLPKLNNFPLTEIIIHPRYAKQLYKGNADLDLFLHCKELTTHKLCYNGDINSLETFNTYNLKLKTISSFMLGRGLVANPFLADEIKNNNLNNSANKRELFKEFHQSLYDAYIEKLSDKNHVLSRMKPLWAYFSELFIEDRKVNKMIKKSTTLIRFNNAVKEIFQEYSFHD